MDKLISLIVPYYENPRMLHVQLGEWDNWPEELKSKTEIIVIDDGSPITPITDAYCNIKAKISLYRIHQDIPWNWIACRNIGAHHANGDWLMMTDIDHIVTGELLQYLHDMPVDPNCFYVPSRVDGPKRTPNPKPHPNSYFMSKEFFWKVGGYDENYSGLYGTDGIWRRRCEAVGKRVLLDVPLVQYLPEHVADCRSNLERKSEAQRQAVLDVTAKGLPVKTLSFPYERVL